MANSGLARVVDQLADRIEQCDPESARRGSSVESSETSLTAARPAELRLEVVGSDRLEVSAAGAFTSACHQAVADRLARLVAATPGCLRIDCSGITSIDRDVANLFAEVAAELRTAGRTLEIVRMPSSLTSDDSLAAPVVISAGTVRPVAS